MKNRLLVKLKRWTNNAFFREYRYKRTVRRHLAKYYSESAPASASKEKIVICMSDGKMYHGGLADRLRSFVSIYEYCRERGCRFAINFTSPFRLDDYLVPAEYDWRLKPGELTFNSREAIAVVLDSVKDPGPRERELAFQRKITAEFLDDKGHRQHHVYSNFSFGEDNFGESFKELFRPASWLEELTHKEMQILGEGYVSVSTRFMDLLGDFEEPNPSVVLSENERERLIECSYRQLLRIHENHPGVRILLTSDSTRFLDRCRNLPFIHIVAGDIAHVDVTGKSADWTKTFLDFLLISRAKMVYQVKCGRMYGGNFSLRAAQAGMKPHHLVEVE